MIQTYIKNIELKLETSADVFSPLAVDRGTLAMLANVEFQAGDKVLDLGCGYGVVGILAAKIIGADNVTMSDVSDNALYLAYRNADLNGVGGIRIIDSNGFAAIDVKDYTLILCNPPYHTDFSVAKEFIENGYHHLAAGGRLFMVTKRLTWYKNKFISVFSGVKINEVDGYFIFMAEKRENTASPKRHKPEKRSMSRKLTRKIRRSGKEG